MFDTSAPAKGSDARAYVDALSAAFDKIELALLDWTTAQIDAAPVPPVTVEPPGMPPEPRRYAACAGHATRAVAHQRLI